MTFAQEFKKPKDPAEIVNSILIHAMEAPNKQALQFIIVNDTRKLIPYDRAILCEIDKNKKITILNISGQSSTHSLTEYYKNLSDLLLGLKAPQTIQNLTVDDFSNSKDLFSDYQKRHTATIVWLPIFSRGKLSLGLWLEYWDKPSDDSISEKTKEMLTKSLLPAYGALWAKYRLKFKHANYDKYKYILPALLALGTILFFVQLPLKIVAYCEVIPKDPTIITAPLQGVIENIFVKPGDHVNDGERLFKYDRRLFEETLKVSQNEFAIVQAALDRALTLGIHENSSLDDVAILKLRLQKQKIDLDLAKDNYEKVDVKSPVKGTVIIDNIDEWIGKPVQIGEKVMKIADLSKTKVKIWIPENDNVNINPEIPIQINLNVDPSSTYHAKLDYIGNEVVISNEQIPSYIAEANWIEPETDVKPGLKGTALLYGEKVSLFYYLIRKPLIIIRKYIVG